MVDEISKDQYHDLCQSSMWDNTESFHRALEQMTGITAKQYIGYSYYDKYGMYIGDSNNSTLGDLLNNAYIKVEDMMVY